MEELTKAVLAVRSLRGREGRDELAISATLQGSLLARLDRLSTGKEVAQLAAVAGREFTDELLQAVSPLDRPTLRRELDRLVDAGILDRRDQPPRAGYAFKHALIQEAAYHSLLKARDSGSSGWGTPAGTWRCSATPTGRASGAGVRVAP